MRYRWRLIIMACGALICAGCATSLFCEPTIRPLIPIVDRVYLFITPKELRDEVSYPPDQTRQKLTWRDQGFHWEIKFPPHRYAYAGLELKRRTDLSPIIDHGDLIFTLTPASASTNLSIALVDGTNEPARVMVTLPMPACPSSLSANRGVVRIPLRTFSTHGAILDSDAAGSIAPFDSSDLREIRIIGGAGLSDSLVTISYLRAEH
jgi:hypothetical protein